LELSDISAVFFGTIARSTALRKAPAIERIAATAGWFFALQRRVMARLYSLSERLVAALGP
jgi:hypothetical protein